MKKSDALSRNMDRLRAAYQARDKAPAPDGWPGKWHDGTMRRIRMLAAEQSMEERAAAVAERGWQALGGLAWRMAGACCALALAAGMMAWRAESPADLMAELYVNEPVVYAMMEETGY